MMSLRATYGPMSCMFETSGVETVKDFILLYCTALYLPMCLFAFLSVSCALVTPDRKQQKVQFHAEVNHGNYNLR